MVQNEGNWLLCKAMAMTVYGRVAEFVTRKDA